jgi:hypothetical protein
MVKSCLRRLDHGALFILKWFVPERHRCFRLRYNIKILEVQHRDEIEHVNNVIQKSKLLWVHCKSTSNFHN